MPSLTWLFPSKGTFCFSTHSLGVFPPLLPFINIQILSLYPSHNLIPSSLVPLFALHSLLNPFLYFCFPTYFAELLWFFIFPMIGSLPCFGTASLKLSLTFLSVDCTFLCKHTILDTIPLKSHFESSLYLPLRTASPHSSLPYSTAL